MMNLTRETKRGFGNVRNVYLKLTMGESVKVY
jgi:ribosomal protein L1